MSKSFDVELPEDRSDNEGHSQFNGKLVGNFADLMTAHEKRDYVHALEQMVVVTPDVKNVPELLAHIVRNAVTRFMATAEMPEVGPVEMEYLDRMEAARISKMAPAAREEARRMLNDGYHPDYVVEQIAIEFPGFEYSLPPRVQEALESSSAQGFRDLGKSHRHFLAAFARCTDGFKPGAWVSGKDLCVSARPDFPSELANIDNAKSRFNFLHRWSALGVIETAERKGRWRLSSRMESILIQYQAEKEIEDQLSESVE